MNITAINNTSTFALAEYANGKLKSLVEQLDKGSLSIGMNLGVPFFGRHDRQWSIQVTVKEHEYADIHGDYVALGNLVRDSDEVDDLVRVVEKRLAEQRMAA